jgi:rare lipoprotein A
MLRPTYLNACFGLLLLNCAVLGDADAHSLTRQPPSTSLHEQTGLASFYGDQLQGHRTASGRRFDNRAFTAASLSLPINSKAKVTSLKTGLSVTVTIIDRGPFTKARAIDLSQAAAEEIGITAREGIGMVLIEPLGARAANMHDRNL